jgi:hypothetical protein
MRHVLFAFVTGTVFGVAGPAVARRGHGGKGPEVKAVSAVDVAEEAGGNKAEATTFEVAFPPGAAGTPARSSATC